MDLTLRTEIWTNFSESDRTLWIMEYLYKMKVIKTLGIKIIWPIYLTILSVVERNNRHL